MAIKVAGTPLTMVEIAAEFGGTPPYTLSQYYRGGARVPNGPAANNAIATSGPIRMGAFYGASKEFPLAIGNTTNYNLLTAFTSTYGAPVGAVIVRLTCTGVIGATSTAYNAFVVGQFPTGSTIIIDNYGQILGAGGAGGGYYSAGAAGGTSIYANYPNQTVTINNKAGGLIYGGGGGGGSGGYGGAGGVGGQGYYVQGANETRYDYNAGNPGAAANYWHEWWDYTNQTVAAYYIEWDNVNRSPAAPFSKGTLLYHEIPGGEGGYEYKFYQIVYSWTYNVYTSGGGGGGNTVGGAGGRGYGYDGANQGGAGGQAPLGGAAGGVNAGAGGNSAWGGTGGTGGGWGAAGNTGGTGGTGDGGGWGNGGGWGTAGQAGLGGAGGGAAGYYLIKGGANVTLNNSGGLAGSLG